MKEKIECSHCHKMVSARNITTHQKTKRCKNYNDKTTGKNNVTITSPAAGSVFPAAPVESSHSKILTEINLNKEFEKMSVKFESKQEDKEKKYKYKCGECGEYFNLPAAGDKCPFCGV